MSGAGAYLIQDYALRNPGLVQGLWLANGMIDSKEVLSATRKRLTEMPQWAQDAIHDAEKKGKYDGEDYKKADTVRNLCV